MKRGVLAAALLAMLLGCAKKPPVPKVSPAPAVPLPSYELRLGKLTFQHYCQTCHGETGAGDGFNAFNLDPRPRDLSDPAFQKKKSDAELLDAIRRGGAGVGLTSLMPPWGHTLSPQEIDQVLLYVRALKRAAGGTAAAAPRDAQR